MHGCLQHPPGISDTFQEVSGRGFLEHRYQVWLVAPSSFLRVLSTVNGRHEQTMCTIGSTFYKLQMRGVRSGVRGAGSAAGHIMSCTIATPLDHRP